MWFIITGSFITVILTNWLSPTGVGWNTEAVNHFQLGWNKVTIVPKLHFHGMKLILVKRWITSSLFFLQDCEILKLSLFSRKWLEKTVAHSPDLCDVLALVQDIFTVALQGSEANFTHLNHILSIFSPLLLLPDDKFYNNSTKLQLLVFIFKLSCSCALS